MSKPLTGALSSVLKHINNISFSIGFGGLRVSRRSCCSLIGVQQQVDLEGRAGVEEDAGFWKAFEIRFSACTAHQADLPDLALERRVETLLPLRNRQIQQNVKQLV